MVVEGGDNTVGAVGGMMGCWCSGTFRIVKQGGFIFIYFLILIKKIHFYI